jgi:hypothetical protein
MKVERISEKEWIEETTTEDVSVGGGGQTRALACTAIRFSISFGYTKYTGNTESKERETFEAPLRRFLSIHYKHKR